MEVQINPLAVVLAMVSSMVIGMIWYAKPVFGTRWMKLVGMTDAKAKQGADKAIGLTVVVSLITAYVLAHVSYLSNSFFANSFLQDSLTTAFWMWLGFVAARFITHDLFEQRPTELSVLTVVHEFVTLMVMGLVIGLVGV